MYFDPEVLPIHSTADETALEMRRLQPDWLRQRFAQPPGWAPETTDEYVLASVTEFRQASVLIPIVLRDVGLSLLMTRRAEHLNDHAGQISFPGGRFESADITAVETALREAEEEIGLQRAHVDVLGLLPDYMTGSGYRVKPVVALVRPPFDLRADATEVSDIFEVPLAFLMDGRHHQRRLVDLPGKLGQRMFYAMPYQDYFIWGATAGMLRNLFHFLRA